MTISINQPPCITGAPANFTNCPGQSATFSVTATGGTPSIIGGGLTYQWQVSSNAGPFTSISDATNTSYTIPSTTQSENGNQYNVVVSIGGCSPMTSAAATLVVPVPPAPATVGATVCGSGVASLSATGTGGTLNWYSDVGLTTLVNTGASYGPTVSATTTFYVAETSGPGCQGPASPVTATVYPTASVSAGPAASACALTGATGIQTWSSVAGEQPGLDVRGWPNTSGAVDGALFDLYNPSPAPVNSTYNGTIGYATQSINNDAGDGANNDFFSNGNGSGVPDSSPRPIGTYFAPFTVEYRGQIYIATAGNYVFTTTSDDGSALWIDPGTEDPAYANANVANGGSHAQRP